MRDRVLSFPTACMTGSCKGVQVIESKIKECGTHPSLCGHYTSY
jgi:hypothetical protein